MEQKTKNIQKVAVASVILILIAAIVTLSVLYSSSFRKESNGGYDYTAEITVDHNEGFTLSETTAQNMKLSMTKLSALSASQSGGIALTANVMPETAGNKTVLWSAEWKNPSSSWANGKDVGDYVTMSAETSESGESINVSCVKDFGEQIIIKAISESDEAVYATCTADYCQKIKALNYTFKYGGSQMATPSAGSDGVYRVDYTGEEKSYTVDCVPVYTAFTVEDEFTQAISGDFTSAFGYQKSVSITTIELQAGLYNTNFEPALSEDGERYVELVTSMLKATGNPLIAMATQASQLYPNLSEQDKAHSKVVNASQAFQLISDALIAAGGSGAIPDTVRNEAKAIIESYIPPETTGDFTGGIQIASVDDLLNAAKNCNDANMGIMDYVITYTGSNSTATFTFKIGYTETSVSAVRSMTISQSTVLF